VIESWTLTTVSPPVSGVLLARIHRITAVPDEAEGEIGWLERTASPSRVVHTFAECDVERAVVRGERRPRNDGQILLRGKIEIGFRVILIHVVSLYPVRGPGCARNPDLVEKAVKIIEARNVPEKKRFRGSIDGPGCLWIAVLLFPQLVTLSQS